MYYSWESRIIVVMKENAQSKENPANTSEWNSSSVYIFSTLFPCFSREGTIQSNEYIIWNESCTFHVRWTYWKSWITQLEFSDYLNILCYRCNCTAELESLFWYMWQCLARSRRGFWCVQCSAVHVERKKLMKYSKEILAILFSTQRGSTFTSKMPFYSYQILALFCSRKLKT